MNQRRAGFIRYLTFGSALLLVACATEQEISPQATSGLTKVRAQAVQLKEQLSRTTDSARKVSESKGPQLASSIDSLSGNLDSLNSTIGMGRQSVRTAQDQVSAYFADWDKQTRGMSEDMQKTSKERQTEAAASFGELQAAIAEVRTNLSPYVSDMSEIVKYLRTDQTSAGVDAVAPRLSTTIDKEPVIQKDLDDVIAQIDSIQHTGQ